MFFELHSGGERAVLVQIAIDGGANEPDLGEFIELVRSAGGDPAAWCARAVHPQLNILSGKVSLKK